MYKKVKMVRSQINRNESLEGETIEHKFQRILNNNEPIKDGAPLIYTEKAEGVKAGYNIRTDRFDVALDAMTVVHRSATAKRDALNKPEEKKTTEQKDVKDETIQANGDE